MSEGPPTIKLRVLKSTTSLLIDGELQCRVTICFEAPTKDVVDAVIKHLDNFEVRGGIHQEAVDVLTDEISEILKVKDALIQQHKEEVTRLLESSAIQSREVNRLRRIEAQLSNLAGLSVKPAPKLVP